MHRLKINFKKLAKIDKPQEYKHQSKKIYTQKKKAL